MDEQQQLASGSVAWEGRGYGSQGLERAVRLDTERNANDPEQWSAGFKWAIVAILSLMSFNVSFTCGAVVPVAGDIVFDLGNGIGSKSTAVLLVTVWEFGEAAGPLMLAPLSERYGRYAVINSANAAFTVAITLTALCKSIPLLIVARLLTGLSVAPNVLNPAIIGDMFLPERRGSAMTMIMMMTLVGTAAGPAVGGAVGQAFGWRQVIWISVAIAGANQVLLITLLKETYRVRLGGEIAGSGGRLNVACHKPDAGLRGRWRSVTRPAQIFCRSSVLVALCLFHGTAFAYFYIVVVTLPDFLINIYNLSPMEAGSSFVYLTAGTGIGVVLCMLSIDRVYEKLRRLRNGTGQPEFYLPLALASAFGQPASLLLYGWIVHLRLPLPYLLLTLVALGLTLLFSTLPVSAYVVHAFGIYSASATAAVIVTRCLMAASVPLAVWPLVDALGCGWSFVVLSSAGFCLAPVPFLLMRHGYSWRQYSEYTKVEELECGERQERQPMLT